VCARRSDFQFTGDLRYSNDQFYRNASLRRPGNLICSVFAVQSVRAARVAYVYGSVISSIGRTFFLFGIFPSGVGASHCLKEKKKTPDANIIHHATGQGRESDVRINFTGGVGYRSRPNSRCTRALGWHSGLTMDLNKVRSNARECWRNECERSAISQCCHLVITSHHATDARLGHFAASTL
jgi:hypothetical protein